MIYIRATSFTQWKSCQLNKVKLREWRLLSLEEELLLWTQFFQKTHWMNLNLDINSVKLNQRNQELKSKGKRRERRENRKTKREVQDSTMISMMIRIKKMIKKINLKRDQEEMIKKICHQKICLEANN